MRPGTKTLLALGFGVVGAMTLVAGAGEEREEQVSLDQLPPGVKATILREARGGTIQEIERELEHGRIVYEAEVIIDGKEFDIEVAADGTLLTKDGDKHEEETERAVSAKEVPAAALATLKKLAAGAQITEFAEEIEHGHTFYEGSWKAPSGGNMDVLVTAAGDLVEIEEQVTLDRVPATVLAAARKAAGADARIGFEKKTLILYEVKFRKGDAWHELLLTADGRCVEEEVERGGDEEGDD